MSSSKTQAQLSKSVCLHHHLRSTSLGTTAEQWRHERKDGDCRNANIAALNLSSNSCHTHHSTAERAGLSQLATTKDLQQLFEGGELVARECLDQLSHSVGEWAQLLLKARPQLWRHSTVWILQAVHHIDDFALGQPSQDQVQNGPKILNC